MVWVLVTLEILTLSALMAGKISLNTLSCGSRTGIPKFYGALSDPGFPGTEGFPAAARLSVLGWERPGQSSQLVILSSGHILDINV